MQCILEIICILRFPSMTLTVEIISGQHIPKPKGATEGEVVDPYIEVIVLESEFLVAKLLYKR